MHILNVMNNVSGGAVGGGSGHSAEAATNHESVI